MTESTVAELDWVDDAYDDDDACDDPYGWVCVDDDIDWEDDDDE